MVQHIFTTADLLAAGLTKADLRARLASGTLVRLRRGWYAEPGADADTASVIRAGAHLGCLSGCRAHGLWVPPHSGVHGAYGRGVLPAHRQGLQLHPYAARQPDSPIWPLEDCLEQVIARHDREAALVVVESAVNKGMLGQEVAEQLVRRAPGGDLRHLLGRARSGSETRVRLFFQLRRVPVWPLVYLPGVGEVDLLVGDRLIIECDSHTFHGSPEAQQNDALRDLNGHLLGYQRIRLTYGQIWTSWPETRVSLSAVLRQRRHTHRLRTSSATTPSAQVRAVALAQHHAQRRRIHSIEYEEDVRDIL